MNIFANNFLVQLSDSTQPVWLLVILVIASYLIGNINPAIIMGKMYGLDIRDSGSGNAGTTNVLRTIGKKAGVITFVVDVLKGVVCTLLPLLFISLPVALLCGVAVIVGHMFPVFHGFRGGKGVATTFGALLGINVLLALALIAIFIVVVLIFKRVSLGVIVALIVAVPIGGLFNELYPLWILIFAVLIVFKHRQNIVRLVKGVEPKISIGSKEKKETKEEA